MIPNKIFNDLMDASSYLDRMFYTIRDASKHEMTAEEKKAVSSILRDFARTAEKIDQLIG